MDKLDAMNAFVKVVTLGSYAEAGRVLGLTRSAVSKAVIELEQLLGARLLDRTTRRVSATDAGLAYYHSCVDIIARVEETEMQVSRLHDEPRGVLRINGPMSFGERFLGPALSEFGSKYPDLKIEMTLNDRFIDPLEEGFDVTVRIAILEDSSLISRRLAPARRVLVASPRYVAERGAPTTPEELSGHRCLNYGHTSALQRWQLTRDGAPFSVEIQSVFCSNNGDVLRAAAIHGCGISMLPTFMVGPDIKAGNLTVVLAEFPPVELGIHALYAPNKYLAAKTRLLIDFLAQRFGNKPEWDRFDGS